MAYLLTMALLALAQPPADAGPPPAAPPATPAPTPPPGDAPPPVAAPPPSAEGRTVYTPADFARFAPRTALDLLRNVPGFTIRLQDERRGLGQATSNVILNGERFSGKSNDVVTELGRIAVANVLRVEIVDGATLDIPGLSGQVANVVTLATGVSGTFAWLPEFRQRGVGPQLTRGEVSLNGRLGAVDYTVSLANTAARSGNDGPELLLDPAGAILDRRAEVFRVAQERPRVSARLQRAVPGGDVWNLNVAAEYTRVRQRERSRRSGPGLPDRDRLLREEQRRPGYEVGGDYEFAALGGRLKLIGLRRAEHTDFSQDLTEAFAGGSTADRYTQETDEAETIARAEFRWKRGKADWQLSVEGAVNALDAANALFTRDAAGVFRAVPFPDPVSSVEERRAEAILSYGRPLSKTLSLQASAGAEYSRLAQTGGGGRVRSFVRPKGQLALAWKPRAATDLSLKVEREVGQLAFIDFLSSANINAELTNSGNLDLVPPQSWNVDVQATRNLAAWGNVTARGFVRFVEDIVDVVPIGATGQSPGNVGDAVRYGGQLTTTSNFEPIGWRGGRLDVDLTLQRSRLTDPLTGRRRAAGEIFETDLTATLRWDVPRTDWALGALVTGYTQSPGFRLDQRFRLRVAPVTLGLFVEHKDFYGLVVRGSLYGLTDPVQAFDRTFYAGRRTDPALFTESRRRSAGLILDLSVRGKF